MNKNRGVQGFTLIELMIVLAIIAATVAMVIPKLSNRNNQIKATLRQLTSLSHELHQKAKLTGTTYRIVIDLKDGANGKETQGYWVEKSSSTTLAKPGEEKMVAEKTSDGKEKKISDFEPDKTIFKKVQLLPSTMHFDNIELSRQKDPIRTGKAFIHYLPQGLAEESAIHLVASGNRKWTISIAPLTGKAEVISDSMSLEDLKRQ